MRIIFDGALGPHQGFDGAIGGVLGGFLSLAFSMGHWLELSVLRGNSAPPKRWSARDIVSHPEYPSSMPGGLRTRSLRDGLALVIDVISDAVFSLVVSMERPTVFISGIGEDHKQEAVRGHHFTRSTRPSLRSLLISSPADGNATFRPELNRRQAPLSASSPVGVGQWLGFPADARREAGPRAFNSRMRDSGGALSARNNKIGFPHN